jgi:hypothetical protein
MGLGLPKSSGGDFKPVCKFDARAGRMHRIDKTEAGKVETEITNGFKAAFDLANIDVGWVKWSEGGAPEWVTVKLGQPKPSKPSNDHKPVFRVDIKLSKDLGGDLREFASSAGCVIDAMDALHDAFSKSPEATAGKLPVVALTGVAMVKSGSGQKTSTNYAPNFEIIGWIDRPAEMATKGANGNGHATPVSAPAPVIPPPVSQPAPAQTPNVATEF